MPGYTDKLLPNKNKWSGAVFRFSNLTEKDYDVELRMLYLQRSVNPENMVNRFKGADPVTGCRACV